MTQPARALERCRLERVLNGTVEIIEAPPENRAFPERVNDTLGVCLKSGPDHEVFAEGRRLSYPRDSVCIRPPGCVWSTSGTGLVGFLSFDIEIDELAPRSNGTMSFARPRALTDLNQLANLLRSNATELRKQSAVVALVDALVRAGHLSRLEHGSTAAGSVDRARELLLMRLHAPPSLAELAAAVGENRFVLLRKFRRTIGVPPHTFVLRARIARARALLARGASATEVAHVLGFTDQSHFTRVFKRVVGMTPGAYRHGTRLLLSRL